MLSGYDFPRRAHMRDAFEHEKSQPVFLLTGSHADMRLCVSPQILYDNDCFGRSVKPAVNGQAVILPPAVSGWKELFIVSNERKLTDKLA